MMYEVYLKEVVFHYKQNYTQIIIFNLLVKQADLFLKLGRIYAYHASKISKLLMNKDFF